MGTLLVLLIAIAIFIFWLSQIVALMNMKDSEFPGKNDKILWLGAILIASVAGALAFLLWRTMRSGEAVSDRLADEIGSLIRRDQGEKKPDENHG